MRAEACEAEQAGTFEKKPLGSLYEYIKLSAENLFMDSLTALLRDPDWDLLSANCKSIRFQSLAFRMISKMGALVHQLLCLPARLCPYALLRVVDGKEALDEVQSLPPCLLDEFSKDFMHRFPGPELGSQDAKMCLHLIVERSHCDTVQIEWGHGRVNRLISVQSSHTHAPRFEYVNAQFVAQKHQERRQACKFQTAGKASKVGKRTSSAGVGVLEQEPPEKRAKTRPPGGGGGAWRAFLNLKQKGTQGRTNFSDLKHEYRAHKEAGTPQYQQWVRIGAAATKRHKLSKAPSFGPTTRSTRRKTLSSMRPTTTLAGDLAPPLAVLDTGSAESALDLHKDVNLRQQLREFRRLALAEAKDKRVKQESTLSTLAEYVHREEAEACAAALVSLPQLGSVASGLHLVPDPGLCKLECVFLEELERVKNVASWITDHRRTANLHRFLAADWTMKNRPLLHAAGPEVPEPEATTTQCLQDGYCTCQPDTRCFQIKKIMHNSIKAALKSKAFDKTQLQEAQVCVELTPEAPAAAEDRDEWGQLFEDMGIETEAAGFKFNTGVCTWLHVALQYLSPFRTTFQLLDEVDSDRVGLRRVHQTGRFLGEGEFTQALDQECTWRLDFYTIVNTTAPLVHLRPQAAYVEKLDIPTTQLWPPPARGRKPGSKDQTPRSRRRGLDGSGASHLEGEGGTQTSALQPEAGHAAPGDVQRQASLEQEASEDDVSTISDDWHFSENEEPDHLNALLDEYMEDLQGALDVAEADAMEGLEASLLEVEPMVSDDPQLAETPAEAPRDVPEPLPLQPRADREHDEAHAAPVAPVPPPAPRPAGRVDAGRLKAECVVTVPGGTISYYALKGIFQATCSNRSHGRCVLTRSSAPGSRPSQGRPLGFLMAWLSLGEVFLNKQEHWDRTLWPDAELRAHHRELLHRHPLGPSLLAFEREQREDEGSEPEELA